MRETGTRRRLRPPRRRHLASSLPTPAPFPRPNTPRNAHSSALSFEFSHGSDLIVGNCGPAPAGSEDPQYFREGVAHSGPTINALSANPIRNGGALAGRLVQRGERRPAPRRRGRRLPRHAHPRLRGPLRRHRRAPADPDRRGQEPRRPGRFFPVANRVTGTCAMRFHISPAPPRSRNPATSSASAPRPAPWWSFLWDGAHLHIEDSIRQSALLRLPQDPPARPHRPRRRRRRGFVDFHA